MTRSAIISLSFVSSLSFGRIQHIIPGGCTKFLQPSNVYIKKLFNVASIQGREHYTYVERSLADRLKLCYIEGESKTKIKS